MRTVADARDVVDQVLDSFRAISEFPKVVAAELHGNLCARAGTEVVDQVLQRLVGERDRSRNVLWSRSVLPGRQVFLPQSLPDSVSSEQINSDVLTGTACSSSSARPVFRATERTPSTSATLPRESIGQCGGSVERPSGHEVDIQLNRSLIEAPA